MYYEKLRAIRKLYIAEVEIYYIRIVAENGILVFGGLRFGGYAVGSYILARNRRKEAAHYHHKSDAAGVDHARLFEYGKKLRRLSQRLVADGYEGVEIFDKVLMLGSKLGGGLAHQPHYG